MEGGAVVVGSVHRLRLFDEASTWRSDSPGAAETQNYASLIQARHRHIWRPPASKKKSRS